MCPGFYLPVRFSWPIIIGLVEIYLYFRKNSPQSSHLSKKSLKEDQGLLESIFTIVKQILTRKVYSDHCYRSDSLHRRLCSSGSTAGGAVPPRCEGAAILRCGPSVTSPIWSLKDKIHALQTNRWNRHWSGDWERMFQGQVFMYEWNYKNSNANVVNNSNNIATNNA